MVHGCRLALTPTLSQCREREHARCCRAVASVFVLDIFLRFFPGFEDDGVEVILGFCVGGGAVHMGLEKPRDDGRCLVIVDSCENGGEGHDDRREYGLALVVKGEVCPDVGMVGCCFH